MTDPAVQRRARVKRNRRQAALAAVTEFPLTLKEAERRNGTGRLWTIPDDRFMGVGPLELSSDPKPMEWTVKGVWEKGGYGVWGGPKKTLKTYMLLSMAVAVASGKNYLGAFPVPEAAPVVIMLAEGGQENTKRRLHKIAEMMDVDLAKIPLFIYFDAEPVDSPLFEEVMEQVLEWHRPGLIIIDALYAFHATDVEAQNLYSRGAMLRTFQRLAQGTSLILADHFAKTRQPDLDLDSVSQAGTAEWSQSWALVKHKQAPKVREGLFWLEIAWEGRAGYSQKWKVDWSLGQLDIEDGIHAGPYHVSVTPVGLNDVEDDLDLVVDRVSSEIMSYLRKNPNTKSKTKVRDHVKTECRVSQDTFNKHWDALEREGLVIEIDVTSPKHYWGVK